MKDDTEDEQLKKDQKENPNETNELNELKDINKMIENINEEDISALKGNNSDPNLQKRKAKNLLFGKFNLDKIKLKIKPISIISASGGENEGETRKKKRVKRYISFRKIIFLVIVLISFFFVVRKIKNYLFRKDVNNTLQNNDDKNIEKPQVNTVEKTEDIKIHCQITFKNYH